MITGFNYQSITKYLRYGTVTAVDEISSFVSYGAKESRARKGIGEFDRTNIRRKLSSIHHNGWKNITAAIFLFLSFIFNES